MIYNGAKVYGLIVLMMGSTLLGMSDEVEKYKNKLILSYADSTDNSILKLCPFSSMLTDRELLALMVCNSKQITLTIQEAKGMVANKRGARYNRDNLFKSVGAPASINNRCIYRSSDE